MRISDWSSDVCSSDLADVTRPAAALPQKDILRGLLADGRSAAQLLTLGVALDRLFDRLAVEAVVAAKFAVLGRDHRAHHVAVDVRKAFPILGDAIAVGEHGESHRRRHGGVDEPTEDADQAEPEQPFEGPQIPAKLTLGRP